MPREQLETEEPIRLDPANACLWRGDQQVALRPKDFTVLHTLAKRPGQLVSKDDLLAAGWPETFVDEAVLKNGIRRIRQALGDTARQPRFIETVHRHGYRLRQLLPLVESSHPQSDTLAFLRPVSLERSEPVVGRESELAHLHRWLTKAREGARQVVWVTGEAGAGKTTLVDRFVDTVYHDADLWVGQGQCLDHYGAGEAFLPVLEALGRLGRGPNGPPLIACLTQHAPTWLVQMPGLLPPAELESLQRRIGGTTRDRMLRELAEALEVLTAEHSLLLVLEDLHWCDSSTLDLLAMLARRREPARLLLVGTYRPEEISIYNHPLHAVAQNLRLHQQGIELPLSLLPQEAIETYLAERFPGASFPRTALQLLSQRTEGNPLFMVNVVDTWVAQGWMEEIDGQWVVQGTFDIVQDGIPENLRQLIDYRLDRCRPDEQRIVEVASVAGVEFSAATVAAGLDEPLELVDRWCAALARRGLFLRVENEQVWPDGTVSGGYGFIHALYQEVIYDRIPAARRIQLHQRLGRRLEIGYGDRVGENAAQLALHFERGYDYPRAVQYHQQAAQNATQRSGYQETIIHASAGVALLQRLPEDAERLQRELDLQLLLGPAMMAAKGYGAPEVVHVYSRARDLCQQMDNTAQLIPVLVGLGRASRIRAELHTAQAAGEQILTLVQRIQDDKFLILAHLQCGVTFFFLGQFRLALAHLEQVLSLYDARCHAVLVSLHGDEPRTAALTYIGLAHWHLGYPNTALQRLQEALTLAEALPDSLTYAYVLTGMMWCHQYRREMEATQRYGDTVIALSIEQGFAHRLAQGKLLRGWARAALGDCEVGLAEMRQGLAAYRATEAALHLPYYYAMLSEIHGLMGERPEALRLLSEALVAVDKTDERIYAAELHRLRGEFLLHLSSENASEALSCFKQAIAIAQSQQAKSWELRAAASLARLWQKQGRHSEAHALLAPVYNWFTEGFDTADLRDAKQLLEELS